MPTMFPEIELPDFTTDEVMSVPMYAGSEATGDESLPGPVVHVPPQTGGVELGAAAKPLNDAGAPPPVSVLRLDHCEPQKVTFDEPACAAEASPSTNAPREGKANTIAVAAAEDGR